MVTGFDGGMYVYDSTGRNFFKYGFPYSYAEGDPKDKTFEAFRSHEKNPNLKKENDTGLYRF